MMWRKVKLGDIAEFSNGINFDKGAYSKGVKLINVSNFGNRFSPEYDSLDEIKGEVVRNNDLLSMIAELYLQIYGDFKYQEHIQSICQKWINGQTPMEISNEETIGIAEVEALCNKRISYEMNFLIGNICDLIAVDEENEEQVDPRNILTLLQKKVKYGVPNMTAISICESIFNDRLCWRRNHSDSVAGALHQPETWCPL